MGWLKSSVFPNIVRMLVTWDVFQFEISPLNLYWYFAMKASLIFLTRLTSQFGIVPKFVVDVPYVVHSPVTGDSLKHELIAPKKVASVK